MKKHLLALAVAAAVAACGERVDTADTTATDATTASTSSAPSTAPAPATDSTASVPGTTTPSDPSGGPIASTPPAGTADSSASVGSATPGSTDLASNTSAMGANGNGQTVYGATCAMCHAAGVAGAPKPGDKADWTPRIAQGKDTLYKHAIEGYQGQKGMMPPKGGNASIPDADVKAAVDFMVEKSQ